MSENKSSLSNQVLREYFGDYFINLPTIDSTNSYAKFLAKANCPKKTLVVLSEEQTGGRGRLGRSFFSEKGVGLYMSILFFPTVTHDKLQLITTAASVATCKAIEKLTGLSPKIKWVNDLYLDGKKIAGILTEGQIDPSTGKTEFAVLGIGINIFSPEKNFPQDISHIAHSIFPETHPQGSASHPFIRERLAGEIFKEFTEIYDHIDTLPHFDDYKNRLFIKGMTVDVIQGDLIKPAKIVDLLEDFSLLVEYTDGTNEVLISGEVSLKLNKKD